MAAPNSLGLDFDQLKIDDTSPDQPDNTSLVEPDLDKSEKTDKIEKKKPYVNAERVKTGGPQRDKLSDEALAERMARIKEQNEKIKQRRLDVKADEEAFRKMQESERIKLAATRKVQEGIDRTREQNAKRKMDKIQSREWDSGKPAGDWKTGAKNHVPQVAKKDMLTVDGPPNSTDISSAHDSGSWARGISRGRPSRGRGSDKDRGGLAHQAPRGDNIPSVTEESPRGTVAIPSTSPSTENPKDS
ncbi:hypothetical protein H0H93_012900 [Arthromyces matolae]|nr:hypothetical protein H0H93_012900 [Arthromyces matolae]